MMPVEALDGARGTTRARVAIVLADSIARAPVFHPQSTLATVSRIGSLRPNEIDSIACTHAVHSRLHSVPQEPFLITRY